MLGAAAFDLAHQRAATRGDEGNAAGSGDAGGNVDGAALNAATAAGQRRKDLQNNRRARENISGADRGAITVETVVGHGNESMKYLRRSSTTLNGDRRIAFDAQTGSAPRVIFLGGFTSDMTGRKATYLAHWAAQSAVAYTRFDYSGHGASDGAFTDGTIGAWTNDALAVIDASPEPLILVGSSMGGWIMVLAALARPDRVKGLVGVASAPDFTEELVWQRLDDAERAAVAAAGRLERPSPYGPAPTIYTHRLIEEARQHLVLQGPIGLDIPVRLLHGRSDTDVPWQMSERLHDRLVSTDKALEIIDNGDHPLSRDGDLERLAVAVAEVRGAVDGG